MLEYRSEAERAILSRFHVGKKVPALFTLDDVDDSIQTAYALIWKRIQNGKIQAALILSPDRFFISTALRSAVDLYRQKWGRHQCGIKAMLIKAVTLLSQFGNRYNTSVLDEPETIRIFFSDVCGLRGKASQVLALIYTGHEDQSIVDSLKLSWCHFERLRSRGIRRLQDRIKDDPVCADRMKLALFD
jgi:hypothetical protein